MTDTYHLDKQRIVTIKHFSTGERIASAEMIFLPPDKSWIVFETDEGEFYEGMVAKVKVVVSKSTRPSVYGTFHNDVSYEVYIRSVINLMRN
uniref:Uncharacterized protein n=1 Tax=Rhizobium phage IG49 TaxID=3129228 RepID=A0AAU8HYR9_9CAUD